MNSSNIIKTSEGNMSHNLYYEELIAAADIYEVAQHLIPERITKSTQVKLHCNCPHHSSESKESLHIDAEKQLWYCFGCGKGGDVIQLVEFIKTGDISKGKTGAQSYNHRRARDYLANKYNLPLLGESQLTPEQIEELEIERKKEIRTYQCFTEIAYFYNNKLQQNQEVTQWILDNYAISKNTISELKIGFADNIKIYDHLISLKFTPDEILSTGAFIKSSPSKFPLFSERITFPYWSRGRGVVYMIGRKTPWTPKDKHESRKYKKSLVHNEKHPYVSKCINNSTLYNEDCLIRKPPVIVIAEGITDAISAMERGFNAISPVTVRFKKTDIDRLSRKLTGYSGKIIIIPDNEISKVGLDGALNTARTLSEQGLDARIAELPLEEIHVSARKALQQKYGIDLNKSSSEIANQIKKFTEDRDQRRIGELKKLSKIDINDYFKKGHSKEEFEKIFNDALTPLELSIAAIDPESDILDINEALIQIMAEINILDPVQQEHYLKEINKKLPKTTLAALRKTAAKVKENNREPSQKEQNSLNKLLDIFYESGCSVFTDHLGNGWITANINNHYENIQIESSKFQRMMLKKYHTVYKAGVEVETIKKMGMLLIEGATETRELFNRFAWLEDKLLIDMGGKNWESIEVSAKGWRIIQPEKPVFRRFSHQLPMSIPQKGGNIRQILKYISVKDKEDSALLLVWICTSMFEHIARPIIILHGIQGACKTSAADFLRTIVDTSSVLHSALSKDHSEFVQFIDHHAVVSLDNLSSLPTWACDDLCQAVTGGGLSKRSLYTNDDDFTYRFRRAFILNGISVPTAAPDLLDRSILIELNRLEKKDRKKETKLKKDFEEDLPYILGHILDVMVAVISRRDEEFSEYTRLADWFGLARIAAEELGVLDDFLNAFTRNEKEQHIEVVESHIESQILIQFLEGKESWEGTPTEFYEELTDIAEEQKLKRNWPKNAASLVKRIKKLSHNLQEMGINFKSSSLGKSRMISIKIDESLSLSKSPTDCLRYPVSEANPNEKEITTPMSSLPDEVQRWDECLQEFFCTRSGSYMDDGMSIEESNLYAMEDVKNSPEYLIYQKTIGVNC